MQVDRFILTNTGLGRLSPKNVTRVTTEIRNEKEFCSY
nr:MAG TPA: hypothetical protein [Caudoviricetes sp.]